MSRGQMRKDVRLKCLTMAFHYYHNLADIL